MTANRTPFRSGIACTALAVALAVLVPNVSRAQRVRANTGEARGSVARSVPASPSAWEPPAAPTRPIRTPEEPARAATAEPAPARRTVTRPDPTEPGDRRPQSSVASPWWTIAALLFVVGLFLALARIWRRHGTGTTAGLPSEAIEVLGRHRVDARNGLQLVRLGSRILVLANGPEGLRTLTEIDDPVEVDYLAGMCRGAQQEHPVADTFRSWFRRATAERATAERGTTEREAKGRGDSGNATEATSRRGEKPPEPRTPRNAGEDELRRRLSDRLQRSAAPHEEESARA